MAANDKAAMLTILERCSAVMDGEMDLLKSWATKAQNAGRASRCSARRTRIQSGPRARMDSLLAQARATPPPSVKNSPTKQHDALVRPNETSLKERSSWNVNTLSDPMFTRALDRAEENSADAFKDAQTIFRDCVP